ncbi:hypothetical protein H072_926 [Dactylellina haptotyla CBS 200.50]|uniref:TauD/TfdA-like domain-containing protein n=1 Tax=Dactylellina haptotyla (strain CBS 200.50) TaxID=1284197 RepID=S8CBR2_DACHA|nr:hypothetical protein H072_926 [Dactylellina haptotyla CBS 200.50]
MAPAAPVQNDREQVLVNLPPGSGPTVYKEAYDNGPRSYEREINKKDTAPPPKYPNYLPTWNPDVKYPPLTPFEHYDHGKDADSTFPNLLKGAKVTDLTSNIGVEIEGIQLSSLTDAGKDELALYVAQKKVVAFRNQDFADLPIQEALDYGGYFGRHHIHPTSGGPAGHPEVHLVHRSVDDTSAQDFLKEHSNSLTWHSDVTYEKQPPGTTFLYLLDGPPTGGDTLFANMAEAYNRLSPEFRKRLHGLKAVHSAHEQATASLVRGGIVRREPVTSVHPVVREHPVTKEKAIFVNPQFTRYIVGYKKEESDFLLKFLYDHVAFGQDFQARVKWAPGTVVVWDNRVTFHSAILDWFDGHRRHLARITPQAEAPYEAPLEG